MITGDGLVLREWAESDLATMVELFDEESIDAWTPLEAPFDEAAARRYLERAAAGRAAGLCVQLAITTDGRTPLGEVLLFDGDAPHRAELAYAVGIRHRGRRLGARAVGLTMEYARRNLGITEFALTISPANPASQAVARANGFALTDAPTHVRERKGRRLEMAIWSTEGRSA
ncbi:MAG TPA: GNAT family N-acetyltransferase [Micromonosporaceae bacterium]